MANKKYQITGRLFRDKPRNTATLYVKLSNAQGEITPEIRIGYKNFMQEGQMQTETVVRHTGETVDGLKCRIGTVAYGHYQLDFDIADYTQSEVWHTETGKEGSNLVASSDAQAVHIDQLFANRDESVTDAIRKPALVKAQTDSTKLRHFLSNIGED